MNAPIKRRVAIVGGGPAGLMAAEVLSREPRFEVTVYDAMPSVGRKFLLAGRGGLNLTHSEAVDSFMARYGTRAQSLWAAIDACPPDHVRRWCEGLGQETFVGSSGRIFPKAMKASGLLRAWLKRLVQQGVRFETRHWWTGFDEAGRLVFVTQDGEVSVQADATLLTLGGASWPRFGSNGAWVNVLEDAGIDVAPLLPANVGFLVAWSDVFRQRFEGQPIKSIAASHGAWSARGEALITASGIEGGVIYALSASLRDAVMESGSATLVIDLKPDMDVAALTQQLQRERSKQSMSTYLRKSVRLPPVAIGLLQEAAFSHGVLLNALEPESLAAAIKAVPVLIAGVSPLEKAISSAGGVRFEAFDEKFMLKALPGVFVAGEMLDWEAPTGGYLLQACFSTGAAAGRGIAEWLDGT